MESLFKIAEASANFILIFMGFLSVLSLAIIIERFFSLNKLSKNSLQIGLKFKEVIETQDTQRVPELAHYDQALEGKALKYGINHITKNSAEGLDELFSSFKTMEKPKLEGNLYILGTIASNAPYIGLLGTVMGIMKAFNDLGNAPGQGNEVVMAGIAHALVSTAIGLGLAIPAVISFNLFQKKVSLILANIDASKDLCLMFAKAKKGFNHGS
ncbi:MAG: MotA/TolQ/ExbB proton channel family protein [Deltaproteobacteria bacterium]|jgi:biopolymer transport protein TolQ|nr:MotA/TolQ/ExbB proton channel family protein [Deltaproteobacteria bacterium]